MKTTLYLATCLALCGMYFCVGYAAAADLPNVSITQPAPSLGDQVLSPTNLLITVVGAALYYFLRGKNASPASPNTPPFSTGRPLLDLFVNLALEKYKGNSIMETIIKAEANAIKEALDKLNVPVVPIPPPQA